MTSAGKKVQSFVEDRDPTFDDQPTIVKNGDRSNTYYMKGANTKPN